jgi:phosphate transport system substrate-binding protein
MRMSREHSFEGSMLKWSISLLWALLVLGGEAEALEGCFCAKDNSAVQKCGEVQRFDPADGVTLKEYVPLNCERRRAPPITLSFLSYTECGPPRVLTECKEEKETEKTEKTEKDKSAEKTGKTETQQTASETFSVTGSNTIGEVLMPALIKSFADFNGYDVEGDRCNAAFRLQANSAVIIRCMARGTHTGIPALVGKEADIAMLSRPITEEEQEQMRLRGFPKMTSVPFESVIALDGLRIIVSRQNRVDALSLDQIARIFSGEIANWSDVGGRPGRINLYVRDTESGTRDTFEYLVMMPRGKRIAGGAQSFESSGGLAYSVENDPYGIGFVGFAYHGDTKALAINGSCGIQHKPSAFLIKTEDYPLSRRLFLYKARPQSAYAEELVDYVLSDAAQAVIERSGYVNQAIESWNATDTRSRVLEYAAAPIREPELDVKSPYVADLLREMNRAKRLSISFHFRFARDDLDTKAVDDVLRLASYLKNRSRSGARLLLLGFADAVGAFDSNLLLSENRAKSVRNALIKTGANLDPAAIITKGYSELMPIACNSSDLEREKNRRVEVYLLDQ